LKFEVGLRAWDFKHQLSGCPLSPKFQARSPTSNFKLQTPNFKLFQTFSESPQEAEEKRLLWELNLAMFKDHPWIGVGYKQNEVLASTYAAKLNLQPTSGQSHSNYIEFLATTGLVGFFSYMLFLLAFILMTARLLTSIPSTHTWHKVFVLAALGAQLAFHIGGLTHRNFGDDIVLHQFLFWLAVISYMSQRYYAHIVPDDRSI
jgi:O-antigen ligase